MGKEPGKRCKLAAEPLCLMGVKSMGYSPPSSLCPPNRKKLLLHMFSCQRNTDSCHRAAVARHASFHRTKPHVISVTYALQPCLAADSPTHVAIKHTRHLLVPPLFSRDLSCLFFAATYCAVAHAVATPLPANPPTDAKALVC